MSGTTLGTPLTMAPEMIKGESKYTSKTDLWSIGIIFYQLLFGEPPFFALSMNELYQEIKKYYGENLPFPNKPKVSFQTKQLLIKLLQIDPDKRINWKEFFNDPVFHQRNTYSPSKASTANVSLRSNMTLAHINSRKSTGSPAYNFNISKVSDFSKKAKKFKNIDLKNGDSFELSNFMKPSVLSPTQTSYNSTIKMD